MDDMKNMVSAAKDYQTSLKCECNGLVDSGPDPPCSTGCMFLITSMHRRVWYTPRSELVLDCTRPSCACW